MKKNLLLFLLSLSTFAIWGQGSLGAIDFSANPSGKNHVDMGTLPIGTGNFTIEFWYKANPDAGDPALFSNKNWASGTNTGLNMYIKSGGQNLGVNFKASTSTRVDINITSVNFTSGWNHIALVINRADSMKCYVNGVFKAGKSIAAATGDLTSALTYKFGQDGTGNYSDGYQVTGSGDEFRVWNSALTPTEIRSNMCKELSGTEPGLIRYFKFNDATGNIAVDATGNGNGTLIAGTAASWTTSGAAIGNESTFQYPSNWTGISSSITGNQSTASISGVNGGLAGYHLYRINAAPSSQTGINNLLSTNEYYGIFLADNNAATLDFNLDYTANTEAQTNESNIMLYSRNAVNSGSWAQPASTAINTSTNSISANLNQSNELVLGYFIGTCDDPANFILNQSGLDFSNFSWTGNAGIYEAEIGPTGFTPGSGTIHTFSDTTATINGLTHSTNYDVYITANCGSGNLSNTSGPFTVNTSTIPQDYLIGSGRAVSNASANGYIELSNGKQSAQTLMLPTDSITVEAWVKPAQYQTWDAFVSFIQDNGSYERGWDLEVRDDNKFAFAVTTNGVIRYLETANSFKVNTWYHVVGTYDGTTQKIYVNGHLEGSSTANSGPIHYSDSWLAIGSYKDDNENNTYNGQVDEIRIWNEARTQEKIRDYMCQKLAGNETNLTHYYRLDEISGTTVTNETGSIPNGNFSNMTASNRVVSGAPIGDESEHTYSVNNWTNTTLSLPGSTNGTGSFTAINGHPYGMHIYRVDGAPDTNPGIDPINQLNTYYGVFIADSNSVIPTTYQFNWNYASYPQAVSSEATMKLALKNMKSDAFWAINFSNTNATTHIITSDTLASRKEFLLSAVTNSCSTPSNGRTSNTTLDQTTLQWQNGGSGISNIQWGASGMNLSQGTPESNITSGQIVLSGLNSDQIYEAYIQDSCGTGNSLWFGPVLIVPERCKEPENVVISNISDTNALINWNALNGSEWVFSWGNSGFNPDWGIQTTESTNSKNMSGLAPNTTYEFYIQSNCLAGTSTWVGPFQFTTLQDLGVDAQSLNIRCYPNPAREFITLSAAENMQTVTILDMAGKEILTRSDLNSTETTLNFGNGTIQNGVYILKVRFENSEVSQKIIISNGY